MHTSTAADADARREARRSWLAGFRTAFEDTADPQETDGSVPLLRDLYAARGYDESRISFREPTAAERSAWRLAPDAFLSYASPPFHALLVDGQAVGWHYARTESRQHGLVFIAYGGGGRMGFREEDDARRVALMTYDASTRAFDRDLGDDPFDTVESPFAYRRRFVVRAHIGDALLVAGTREGSRGDRVLREDSLAAGTMILYDASGTRALLPGRDSGWMRQDIELDLADPRLLELPMSPEWVGADYGIERAPARRFPGDTPRVIGRGRDHGGPASPASVRIPSRDMYARDDFAL